MFWKKKQPSPAEAAAEIVQSLGADISRLVCEANTAFDSRDFAAAGTAMFRAAVLSWGIAGIEIDARILEILGKEKIEVVN